MKINKTTFSSLLYLYYKYLIRNKTILIIIASLFMLLLLNFCFATVWTQDEIQNIIDQIGEIGPGIILGGYNPVSYLDEAILNSSIIIPLIFILITVGVVFNNIFSTHFLKQINLTDNSFLDYLVTFFIIEFVLSLFVFTLSLFSFISVYSIRFSEFWRYAFDPIGILKLYIYFIFFSSFCISIGMFICTLKIDKIVRIIIFILYVLLIFWISAFDQAFSLYQGVTDDPNYIKDDWTRILSQGWFVILLWILNPLAYFQGVYMLVFSSDVYQYYVNDLYLGQLKNVFIVMMTLNLILLTIGTITFIPLSANNIKRREW